MINMQQEMPQKYMAEIIRWFSKLKDANLTSNDLVVEEIKEIVNNKLQITYILKAGKVDIATYVMADNRSLDKIKEDVLAQKAQIEAQHDSLVATADEVLSVINIKK